MAKSKKVKAPSKLNKGEALKELEVLSQEVEFGEEYTEDTPLKDLRAAVAEGRKALKEAEEAAEEDAEEVDEADESEEEEAEDTDEEDDSDDDEEDEEEDDSDDADEEDADDDEEEEAEGDGAVSLTAKEKKAKYITVELKDGSVRTYSQVEHGKKFRVLAKQYAKNKKGKVYTHDGPGYKS